MGNTQRERRRAARRARRERLADMAARMSAPSAPLSWGPGWAGRCMAAAWFVLAVTFGPRPYQEGLVEPSPGDWLFLAWAALVWSWIFCRLALWRITADRSGVWVRRFWSVKHIPWDVIRRVDLRHDGTLELVGRHPELMAGTFAPLWSRRALRLSGSGEAVADTLTLMAQDSRLRPEADVELALRGRPYALWAPIPLTALVAAQLIP
jgi:hypothetical protein